MSIETQLPTILLVEDDELVVDSLTSLLVHHAFKVMSTTTSAGALQLIENIRSPVIIVLDRYINEKGKLVKGEDLLPELVRRSRFQPLSITISGIVDVETQHTMIRAGTTWCLQKNYTGELLIDYIWLAVHQLQMFMGAILDPLTQVLNRKPMYETLTRELARASRTSESIACIMFDVDRLKPINDNYGHLGGDKVIKSVVDSVTKHLRAHIDIIARYGGDEIVVFLFDIDVSNVPSFIEQACKTIASKKVCVMNVNGKTEEICVSASPGFSMITPHDIAQALGLNLDSAKHDVRTKIFEQLTRAAIKKADEKMYEYKKGRESRVTS